MTPSETDGTTTEIRKEQIDVVAIWEDFRTDLMARFKQNDHLEVAGRMALVATFIAFSRYYADRLTKQLDDEDRQMIELMAGMMLHTRCGRHANAKLLAEQLQALSGGAFEVTLPEQTT